ncbi:chemotaxis protein [Pokkaliibacter plantistimulans]|uniref:Chemotaxis protein n=1 Tax=Proteobacteria bacterium 228 TaxID=2083153 RepID=A0A2S5KK50_9PROT|nr:methyl-accepting chemotaxis protein [Pokkaliibacter plantistimulans]PPC75191.1 chemotaxis protein [Pokkaliibacter plantistimulans]
MLLSLSWKQKFWLLISVTLVGLALMAISAFWGLNKVSSSFQSRQEATLYESASLQLLNEWLQIETQSDALTPDNASAYQDQLQSLVNSASNLVSKASDLHDDGIQSAATTIKQGVDSYAALRGQWLQTKQTLGMTPFDGQRKTLAAASEGLNKISLSLIKDDIEAAINNQRDYLSTLNQTFAEQTKQAVAELNKKVKELQWEDTLIGKAVKEYEGTFHQVDQTIGQLRDLESQLQSSGDALKQTIEQQNESVRTGIIATTTKQAESAKQSSTWLMLGMSIAVAVFLLFTLNQVSSTLVRQLNKVMQLLSKVAEGDLTGSLSLTSNRRDEFNQLGEAANRMIRDMSGLIQQVVNGNKNLMQLHQHLSTAMSHLGDNSQQVEMQTEQAASAAQQISATVNEVARRTSDVSNATQEANESALAGSQVIANSVDSMKQLSQLIQNTHNQVELLSQSSGKVTSIIDVINSLADQTNLLALNAAIEAARAGDAGRGFSVVADEVRSLAQKTVSATANIGNIIGEFNQQTREMGKLMESGLSMAAEGEHNASQVADAISGITHAIGTLTAEMDQVVVAVEQISATTEDIASKMEHINIHTSETKTLRHTLDEQTHMLADQVDSLNNTSQRFRVSA